MSQSSSNLQWGIESTVSAWRRSRHLYPPRGELKLRECSRHLLLQHSRMGQQLVCQSALMALAIVEFLRMGEAAQDTLGAERM
ncbi:unnamed protein product [Lampetra planeri]